MRVSFRYICFKIKLFGNNLKSVQSYSSENRCHRENKSYSSFQTDKMINQMIEQRLQNIINTDLIVSKQLAFKTKRLYEKLNFCANATTQNHQTLDEKKVQLLLAEKMLTEHHEMLNSLLESQATLRHQIHRLRIKVTDMKNHINKSEPISPDDRFVYTKNAFKLNLLRRCTKTRFHEVKTQNRTVIMGYVDAVDKLHPFQEKLPVETKQTDVQSMLWEKIKLASPHLNEWNSLFKNERSEHHTF